MSNLAPLFAMEQASFTALTLFGPLTQCIPSKSSTWCFECSTGSQTQLVDMQTFTSFIFILKKPKKVSTALISPHHTGLRCCRGSSLHQTPLAALQRDLIPNSKGKSKI